MRDLKAAFATLLEQTITAPRLSGSKVQTLTTQSLTLTAQNFDTEVVTTFYRVNSGLAPASPARISSLYVFDAIARAARKDADKEKEKGKAREGRGMTGLITKMEGVVDAWVTGMVDDGKGGVWVEGKDKVRKILDIWRKGSTFPPATLDRLQNRITASEAGPSRLAAPAAGPNGHGGASTTPPGTPPAPMFSPVLPPLDLPSAEVPKTNLTAPPHTTASTDPSASQNLPPEILKLLGIQNAPASTQNQATAQPPKSTIDIATLLASVRPAPAPAAAVLASQPGLQGYTQQAPYPPAAAAGGLPFALDPRQLAALTSFAPPAQGQTPPQGSYALPGGFSPAGQAPSYPPYPPQDRPSYGPDQRGSSGRGDHGRSPPYHRNSGGYNDRGPMSPEGRYDSRDGYRDDRGSSRDDWDRRDGGRSSDRGPPGGGRGQGWGDRRQSGGRPRSRSRSPGRGPPRDGGYGGGRDGDRGGRRGGGHQRGRESIDGFGSGEGKPVVRKNYGGFKNQAGRFDPPPSSTASGDAAPSGRAPLPPGRDLAPSRAPLPPGRDMSDEPLLGGGQNSGQAGSANTFNGDTQRNGASRTTSTSLPLQNQTPQSSSFTSAPTAGAPRLETFDLSTFNPMMPECWAALALAWKGTVGTEPGQMELMGFLAGQGPVMPMMPGQGAGMVMGMGGGGGMQQAQGQGFGMGAGGYMGGQGNGF